MNDELREMINIVLDIAKELMRDKDLADATAEFYGNVGGALLERDFTREEVIQILANVKLPEFKGGK